MFRDKYGSQFYTLVGGQIAEGESVEDGLAREVKEETGLELTAHQLVYFQDHPEPYNKQYIYLCEVAPHDDIGLHIDSEEAKLNKLGVNNHTPVWVTKSAFPHIQFNTAPLHLAIIDALKNGFPAKPKQL